MYRDTQEPKLIVNCRIGSLEKFQPPIGTLTFVNCRIGSLENDKTICIVIMLC